jgi:hypothetical protein
MLDKIALTKTLRRIAQTVQTRLAASRRLTTPTSRARIDPATVTY